MLHKGDRASSNPCQPCIPTCSGPNARNFNQTKYNVPNQSGINSRVYPFANYCVAEIHDSSGLMILFRAILHQLPAADGCPCTRHPTLLRLELVDSKASSVLVVE